MDHRKPHREHDIFERVPETDTALEKYREAMDIQKTSQCESNQTIRSCKRKPAAGAGDLGSTGKKIEKLPSQASANDGFSATGSLGALRGVRAPGVDDTVANRSLRPARPSAIAPKAAPADVSPPQASEAQRIPFPAPSTLRQDYMVSTSLHSQ